MEKKYEAIPVSGRWEQVTTYSIMILKLPFPITCTQMSVEFVVSCLRSV